MTTNTTTNEDTQLRVLLRTATSRDAVMAAAVLVLASAAGFRQAMIAALLMSLGGAAVNAAANTLVSTLYGDRRGPIWAKEP